jgi:predicted enzyme related to lactoylglutathione lyase
MLSSPAKPRLLRSRRTEEEARSSDGYANMTNSDGRFVWYELTTPDVKAAKAFYADVVGWGTREASTPAAAPMAYTLLTAGEEPVGGLLNLPERAGQTGVRPHWIGYVSVDDVDAAARRFERLGGTVHVPPTTIPDVSRFSVVADAQTASLVLVKWQDPGPKQSAAVDKPGHVGWHELLAADCEKALVFYRDVFGWQKAEAHTGPTGTYQLFSAGGQTIGGMFNKPPAAPEVFWLYYFNVGDVDAAAERVRAAGGQVLEGPSDIPSGRVARCTDPQGAVFALIGQRGQKTMGYFNASRDPDDRGRRWSW